MLVKFLFTNNFQVKRNLQYSANNLIHRSPNAYCINEVRWSYKVPHGLVSYEPASMEGFYLKKDLYLIFTIGGLVNLLNYYSSCVCCLTSCPSSVICQVFGIGTVFCVGFFFYAYNILPDYNANNHIFKRSVSLLISDNGVPNSYSSIKKNPAHVL